MRESDPDREARLKEIEAELDDELGFRDAVEIEHEPVLKRRTNKAGWSMGKIAVVAVAAVLALALLKPLLRLLLLLAVLGLIVGVVLWLIGLAKGRGSDDDD